MSKDAGEQREVAKRPKLGANIADRSAALARAGIGLVPFVGAALAEVVTELVPNQRVDRIEEYLILLEQRLAELAEQGDAKRVADEIKTPESIALIEDGATLSARLISQDRRAQIVKLVSDGATRDIREAIIAVKFLNICADLDDSDLALLASWAQPTGSVWKLIPNRKEYESEAAYHVASGLFDSSKAKLTRLGLLHFRINMDSQTGLPQTSRITGEAQGHHNITYLGRELISRLGLSEQ